MNAVIPRGASSLEELLVTIERLTGLEASIYPARAGLTPQSITDLPTGYRRHMSAFCRLVKGGARNGCQGHDSSVTNRRAGEVGEPFVQRCHAGVAEVIVPIFGDQGHLATLFLGQVVTEAVAADGIGDIRRRLSGRAINRTELARAFARVPRMPEGELLQIGRLLGWALAGIVTTMNDELLARRLRIEAAPQVRHALQILETERCWTLTQGAMARRVHVSVAHFSRLFKRVVGSTYSDYLTGLRMRAAENLLHQTQLGVNEIAQQLGYSRHSYFTRRFRALTHMSPSDYRHNRQTGEPFDA
ncbi:MAG: helix-turn-helix domain-containing protein [Candidatus Marinimicrobia bacterium]|nr:helix-turn-helix domain-containing protein [Candidatus Neomarinimicrobiota bacterium]